MEEHLAAMLQNPFMMKLLPIMMENKNPELQKYYEMLIADPRVEQFFSVMMDRGDVSEDDLKDPEKMGQHIEINERLMSGS